MTTLKMLAKNIKNRIYPGIFQRVYQSRTKSLKMITFSAIAAVATFALYMLLPQYSGLILLLAAIAIPLAFVLLTMHYLDTSCCYKYISKLDDRTSLGCIPFLRLELNEQQLTQEEMEHLLSIPLSDENLKILNKAISGNGYIVYDDVVDMVKQEIYETEALQRHAQFIENGNYNNSQQQQNLQKLAQINSGKLQQNYKAFNSRKVL